MNRRSFLRTTALAAAATQLPVRLAAADAARAERRMGVTFGFNAVNGYFSSTAARLEVERMAALGVRWCVVVATVLAETATSERQYRDFALTPDDDELRRIIDLLQSKGIRAHLRPMLETHDGHGRTMVWFPPDRERIPGRVSRHRAAWFAGMADRTVHYARIAQQMGCAWYGIDSELDRMVEENDHWKKVVAAARSEFRGPIDSCHTPIVDPAAELKRRDDHWFLDLDALTLCFYRPAATRAGATADEMTAHLTRESLPYYREVARLYPKPIWFGECGCTSSTGGALHPSSWRGDGRYDPAEQANYLEAVCRTFSPEPWWHGLYWWKWEEQADRPQFKNDPAGDKGFTLYGKPAAEVFRQWTDRLG